MSEDYVLYRESTEETTTFKDMDDLDDYARNVLHIRGQNDFATRVYMAEMGVPFEFNGEKFIVWDDEFEGYHEYHASAKKSKSQSTSFSDMVKKQRGKNIQKTIYGEASFESLYRGFDELGTAEQWWIITYLKDKLGMNGFEEFIDNVVAYAHDKYEGQ